MSVDNLEPILQSSAKLEDKLTEVTKAIANALEVDRCFIYVRDPQTRYGCPAFCYCRRNDVPDVSSKEWELERPEDLEAVDPMFAAALNCQQTVYVEDVTTADPQKVNRDFEAREFGHRALIHAHLCESGELWGILQPCIFDRPRRWTDEDKQIIELAVNNITPLIKQYVREINSVVQG